MHASSFFTLAFATLALGSVVNRDTEEADCVSWYSRGVLVSPCTRRTTPSDGSYTVQPMPSPTSTTDIIFTIETVPNPTSTTTESPWCPEGCFTYRLRGAPVCGCHPPTGSMTIQTVPNPTESP